MSNNPETEMKMDDIEHVIEDDNKLFESDKTKKILVILAVLTLLIFVIGNGGGKSVPGTTPVVQAVSDTMSVSSQISEGFGNMMTNVDRLLQQF